jgi:LysM repeat protein
MAKHMMHSHIAKLAGVALACSLLSVATQAQNFPITQQQRDTAKQVAESGVPLSELKADAPASYTVKTGDTLWAISGIFLKTPWRWPELWGMNLNEIKNPHLIYPGQTLFLDTSNGRARLRMGASDGTDGSGLRTVKISPHTRIEGLPGNALVTLKNQLIEPFLTEPIIVSEQGLSAAPRIVAAQDSRVLLTRGDRAYARGNAADPLMDEPSKKLKAFRLFRNATPLKDPMTGEVLGFEAQYIGKATLSRSEGSQNSTNAKGEVRSEIVPATIDIVDAKEEIRVGDRMLPEPPQTFQSYVPHAPAKPVDARIVSVYGSAVVNAAQNQVVAINKGTQDGMESGHVLAILKDGNRLIDKTDITKPQIKLPDERNGLLMVFRTFDRVSYGLILDITSGVKVGDHLVNPN